MYRSLSFSLILELYVFVPSYFDELFLLRLLNFARYSMAYAEMYMVIASLTRRVKMKLHDTTADCVTPHRDHFIVVPKDTRGVRVIVEGINAA